MLRRLYFLLVISVVSASVCGQTPQVYRDRVEPNWFSEDAWFWYQVRLPEQQKEFVLVDVVSGTRTPAFDHQKLAAALSDATKTAITAGRLPVESLEYSPDMASVVVTGKSGVWKVDLANYAVEKRTDAAAENGRLFLPPRRSADSGGDVELTLINGLSKTLTLHWIDRSGERVRYGAIAAGATKQQHTFAGHVWLVTFSDDQPLAAFEAMDAANTFQIDDVALKTLDAARSNVEPRKDNKKGGRRRNDQQAVSPNGLYSASVQNHNLVLHRKSNGKSEVTEKTKAESDPAEPAASEVWPAVQVLTTDASERYSFQKDASRRRLVEMQYSLVDPEDDVAEVHWSPDSRWLMAWQTTSVPEPRVHYIESTPETQLQPVQHSYPYAKPGDPIPVPHPRLFSALDGHEIAISNELFPNPFRLQFLRWSDDGQHFYLLYNARGHQILRVLEVSAADGSVRAVVDELSDTFVHYSSDGKFVLEWLPEQQLLWASERSGWNHLYRYDISSGKVLNAVTTGDWNVRRIEHIDRVAKVVWFHAVGIVKDQDPYHEHFCRVNFDGTGLKVLTDGDGTHEVTLPPNRQVFLDRYSRVDQPPVTVLRHTDDGRLITPLETADASEVLAACGSFPIRFVASGRDGATPIFGIIHLPRFFNPTEKYPVVENIYAGPHNYHVPKSFRSSYRHQQQIADRGMIVVQIDGMGTAWRSKAFHDVCFRNLRDAGFPDRIAWMKAASEKYPWMDLSRVGVYGGSAGGQNAMAALLWHGTFYRAAVADCGCHDNRMDKLWWNEQWMGWPVDAHYAASSNAENAHRLQGHLMLVVGEMDRNVDPASTTQVVRHLVQAGKDFDFLLIPGAGHGACETPYGSKRRADFLARHLKSF